MFSPHCSNLIQEVQAQSRFLVFIGTSIKFPALRTRPRHLVNIHCADSTSVGNIIQYNSRLLIASRADRRHLEHRNRRPTINPPSPRSRALEPADPPQHVDKASDSILVWVWMSGYKRSDKQSKLGN
ncbi:hypothetical protein CLAIMM_13701, partial [Cladophialophora immunda]